MEHQISEPFLLPFCWCLAWMESGIEWTRLSQEILRNTLEIYVAIRSWYVDQKIVLIRECVTRCANHDWWDRKVHCKWWEDSWTSIRICIPSAVDVVHQSWCAQSVKCSLWKHFQFEKPRYNYCTITPSHILHNACQMTFQTPIHTSPSLLSSTPEPLRPLRHFHTLEVDLHAPEGIPFDPCRC